MLQEQTNSSALNILNQDNLSTENQFVTFQIGEEEYGIDIMLVQEIIRYNKPTRVFNSNPVIKGVINFRGKVIPIINMHRKFNLPEGEYDEFTVVIIIEMEKKTMGMVVDRVSDIMSFGADEIQLVDKQFASDIKTEHLKGMGKFGDRIVLLLDPYKILSLVDLQSIEEMAAQEELSDKN
jgi:purine-binding chemotaxis protein CheW